jgi:hypothetical protein
MRDIWIRDIDGELHRELGDCGLATEVWRALYPILAGDPRRPILARLWREQWGPEANATLSPAEVGALESELETLRAELAPDTPAAVRDFCDGLAGLCAKARERGHGLEFVAD